MIADLNYYLRQTSSGLLTRLINRPLAALLMLISLLVVGCGESGVGSGGTGVPEGSQIGTVTGFGSVIVDSNRYDTDAATVTVELDPSNPQTSRIDEVQLGMQVEIQYRNSDQAESIRVLPTLIGLVQRADVDRIVIAGQVVTIVNTTEWTTVFEGFEELANLSGALVRVFGQADGNGAIAATRIERLAGAASTDRLVTGVVTEVMSATQYKLGELTVLTDTQTTVSPATAAVEVGTLLTVIHQPQTVSDQLLASHIIVRAATAPQADGIRLTGPVRLTDVAGQFRVGWVQVDARTAIVTGGSLQDLTNGTVVRIAGVRRGQVVIANTLTFLSTQVVLESQIQGEITDFFSLRSFRVRGAPVDASNAQIVGGETQNLGDGVEVKLRGLSRGGLFAAQQIELINPAQSLPDLSGNVRTIRGRAYLIRPQARLMVINRVIVAWDDQTAISGDLSSVEAGQPIVVTGTRQGDGLFATQIDVEQN